MGPKTTYAGFTALARGMNSGLLPSIISPVEFARGNNVSVRDGFVETRGGWEELKRFTASGSGFRGAKVWSLNAGDYVSFVNGAKVVHYRLDTSETFEFAGYLADGTDWCFLEQADRWMVVQSGVDRPPVFHVDSTTGNPAFFGNNPPTVSLVKATIMQYLHGRLFMVPVVSPNLTPDPTTNPTDVPNDEVGEEGRLVFCAADVRDNLNPEYLFRMTEHRTVAQGGNLTLPAESGFIEGMGVLRGAATGTGVGPLIVFGREVVSAADVAIPRTQWLSTNIMQVLFRGAGTRSSRAIVSVNDDLVYIDSVQQVRFMRYDKSMLAGAGGALYNTPKSNEMKYWISQGDPSYLPEVSAAFVDNMYAWTLIGESKGVFKALGMLDMVPAYTMAGQEPPAYYGVWTGFKFLQVLEARIDQVRGLLAFAKADDGSIVLLRYNPEAVTDPGSTAITSTIVTKVFNFELERVATATDVKRLDYVEFWLGNIKRNTSLSVYYRPYGFPVWKLVGSKNISVPSGAPQHRRAVKIALDQSDTACDDVLQKPLYVGERFEFMIRWTGFARIEMFRAVATQVSEEDPDVCETDNEDANVYGVDPIDPDFDYEVPL